MLQKVSSGHYRQLSAFSQIDISPKEIVVQDKSTTVRIINKGERAEYVLINLSRLLSPGAEVARERLQPIL